MNEQKSDVCEIIEHGATFKDIISDIVKDIIIILIVIAMIYLSIHNNTIDYLKSAFDVVIGFYIAKRGI